jgi:hypothetical protein
MEMLISLKVFTLALAVLAARLFSLPAIFPETQMRSHEHRRKTPLFGN